MNLTKLALPQTKAVCVQRMAARVWPSEVADKITTGEGERGGLEVKVWFKRDATLHSRDLGRFEEAASSEMALVYCVVNMHPGAGAELQLLLLEWGTSLRPRPRVVKRRPKGRTARGDRVPTFEEHMQAVRTSLAHAVCRADVGILARVRRAAWRYNGDRTPLGLGISVLDRANGSGYIVRVTGAQGLLTFTRINALRAAAPCHVTNISMRSEEAVLDLYVSAEENGNDGDEEMLCSAAG